MDEMHSRRGVLRSLGTAGVLASGLVGSATASHGDPDTAPSYPSPAWVAREQANYARTQEEPMRQSTDPAFQQRLQTQSSINTAAYRRRTATEPYWNSEGNLCKEYAEQCCGDPSHYPATVGYEGDPFYDDVDRYHVSFYDTGLDQDAGGARLSGHVWAPAETAADPRPGVVITNGSVQAPETIYWWFVRTLVRAGYVVMTYDPRGQGRSDTATPDDTQGSNANPSVFVTNQIDAIDFFRSRPGTPYEPNGADRYARPDDGAADVRAVNPLHERIDHGRLGIVGHSLGATGVSIVQGIADEAWPGRVDDANPVDVALAWDNLSAPGGSGLAGYEVVPRVPAMGQSADYGLTPQPKTEPPDPDANNDGFAAWRSAGVPAYQVHVRGGTHYEWSRVPTFPATRWASWGNELADHYSLAWLDYWLKRPDEPGWSDARDRLLQDDRWHERLSFYYTSKRFLPPSREHWAGPARDAWSTCENIRAGCPERD